MGVWLVSIDGYEVEPGDEIGIFDGENCVGIGVVKGEIFEQSPFAIITSKEDDGDGSGFVEGNEIRFKFWDSGEDAEVTTITPDFIDMDGNPIDSPGFKGGEDYGVRLVISNGTQPVLSVTPSFQDVPATSGTTTYHVSYSGQDSMNWTVAANDSWLTITRGNSGINEGTITVNYEPNAGEARTGTITVTAPGASGSPKTLEIRQAAAVVESPHLSLTPTLREVSEIGGTVTFDVANSGTGVMNWQMPHGSRSAPHPARTAARSP